MLTVTPARRRLVVATFLVCASTFAQASSPKFFQAATQADFLKGEVENLSVDGRGRLVLGPATELVYETPSPFLWTVMPAPDGSIFIGTGNDGRVFRVDAQGKGASFFDAAELEVHAMALAPNGGLYVATSPDGKIYKVDRNGASTTFFDPQEKYIWALAVDGKGNVYAGTGEKGVVYKITPDGKGTPFYQTKATHATALTFDKSGNLLVGTESPGRVLRVDSDGKGFVLLDSPFQEIRTLRFDDKGALYVAAVNGRAASGAAPSVPTDTGSSGAADSSRTPVASVTVSTEITAVGVVETPGSGGSSASRADNRLTKGAIYRIAPDGLWDQLWESKEDSPYDVAFDADGHLIVATGSKGKIYRLEGDLLQPMLLARASAQQVTALYRDQRGRMYYATANPGKLFRLAPTRATRGTYESEVRDAQMVSSWGSVSWHGTTASGSRVEISTRSGNIETPDDTWSAWSSTYTTPEGSTITSPKARYLQWRAVLSGTGEGPVLTSVTAAYLQRNLRPTVRSITIHPPGIVFQTSPASTIRRRQTASSRRPPKACRELRPHSGDARIKKDCRRLSGAPTMRTTMSSRTTSGTAGKATSGGMRFEEISPTRFSCGTPRPFQTVRISSRSSRRTRRRIQPPQRCRVSSKASRSKSTTHRPRSSSAARALTAIARWSCSM
jgi:hypothetical protein